MIGTISTGQRQSDQRVQHLGGKSKNKSQRKGVLFHGYKYEYVCRKTRSRTLALPGGDGEKSTLRVGNPKHESLFVPTSLYHTRKYSLFAILANVENGGLLEEPYDCIALPRGSTKRIYSPELKAYAEDPQNNDPTIITNWVTLKEVIGFDWGKIRKQYAIVDECVVHLFHPERGFPWSDWPQEIPISYSFTKRSMLMPVGPKAMLTMWAGM